MEEKSEKETLTIKINKQSLWKYSTFILLIAVIILSYLYFTENNTNITGKVIDNPSVAKPAPTAPSAGVRTEVSVDDDPVLGDKNAPVTIIEFSDYECAFCAKFWRETLPLIKKEYIETKKAKLVYRDFPLTQIHPNAMSAAVAANCVRSKGGDTAYWKMHDKIFENISNLSNSRLKALAKELGYDIDSCLDKMDTSEIQKDISDGVNAGVRGTPAFFVNGQIISGAQSFNAFKQIIDSELSKKN